MPLSKACNEVAAAMTDTDLVDAITALGPDSPLLPAVRNEIRRRLEAANRAATAGGAP
jgi:hypothetical protein